MKYLVFRDAAYERALEALRANEVEIAVLESGNTGKTLFYVLGTTKLPKVMRELPGFRSAGVTGIPGAIVSYYECLRTTAEVVAKIPP